MSFAWTAVRSGTRRAPARCRSGSVDNDNSLIDIADLVFVDAIDTGYSRVTAGTNAAQFHGQTGDIRAFTIRASPAWIATPRASGKNTTRRMRRSKGRSRRSSRTTSRAI
jgi:hypothetical protein